MRDAFSLGLDLLLARTPYGMPRSQEEIAAWTGVSHQRIHQIEQDALRKLKVRLPRLLDHGIAPQHDGPLPGEIPLREWLAQEAQRQSKTINCIRLRYYHGKYPRLKTRHVHSHTYITP